MVSSAFIFNPPCKVLIASIFLFEYQSFFFLLWNIFYEADHLQVSDTEL